MLINDGLTAVLTSLVGEGLIAVLTLLVGERLARRFFLAFLTTYGLTAVLTLLVELPTGLTAVFMLSVGEFFFGLTAELTLLVRERLTAVFIDERLKIRLFLPLQGLTEVLPFLISEGLTAVFTLLVG